jgi:tetratricopeptide (TPR) repeat protein
MATYKVFLGSTSQDLRDYRAAAIQVCNELGLVPLAMEFFEAMGRGATAGSKQKLAEADVYAGFFAHRYGYVEEGDRSVTEIEFDYAGERGLERLCFLVDPDHPWPRSKMEVAQFPRLDAFKQRIDRTLIRAPFTTVEDFKSKLMQALVAWLRKQEPQGNGQVAAALALAARHQLPAPPADFTGRVEILDELTQQIGVGVTISGVRGMGGVGKTALALKLAERLTERYPDGQIYLDLKGVNPQPLTAADAMAHVIRAWQPESRLPENEAALAALYRSVLHGKRVLLLLDNAAGKSQVEPLLPPVSCLLLVTSRVKFTLPGLFARDLDEMPRDDAVTLLQTIAPRTGKEAGRIAELCGDLPLALRLAGSALAERPDLVPADYARRLGDARARLDRLDQGIPQGVAASIQLSEDLLPEPLRRLWHLLAVFVGPVDRAAIAAVWDRDTEATDDALGELVRKSVVEWDEVTKAYRLHDLMRLYADRRLCDPDRAEAQRRHARHFLSAAHQANNLYKKGGAALLQGLALFDRAWPNTQAAFAWAQANSEQDGTAVKFCNQLSYAGIVCLQLRQHPQERIDWLEAALQAARKLRSRSAEGAHLGNLGNAYYALGQMEKAIGYHEQNLAIAREIGNRRGEGIALGNLGIAFKALGQVDKAISYYEQRLAIAREIGDRRGESIALGSLGQAYADLGQVDKAIGYHEQDLVIAREIGDRRGEGAALGNLGIVNKNLDQVDKAIGLLEQALVIFREIGDRRGEGIANWELGLAYEKQGDLARAIACMQVCVDYRREIGHLDAEKHAEYVAQLRTRLQTSSP